MASHRRYPLTTHSVYDTALYARREISSILNAKSKRASINTVFFDKQSCLSLQRCFLGTEKGKDGYKVFENDEGNFEIAYIDAVRMKLDEVDAAFETLKESCSRSGKKAPAEMPPEMLEKKLKLEATLDVLQEELEFIQNILATYTEKKEVKLAKDVLRQGPVGTGKMQNGTLAILDGQPVRKLYNGPLIIDCPSSPYNGMSVPDYRESIVRPFLIKRAELQERLRINASQEEAAGRAGAMSINARPALPSWPTGIKQYKVVTEEEEE